MNEGPFGVHQVEFVVQTSPSFADCRRIAQHTDGSLEFGQIATRHDGRRLVVDAYLKKNIRQTSLKYTLSTSCSTEKFPHLKSSRTPVDELYSSFRFHLSYSAVDVFGHDVAPV
uniref:Uncharacterized protein n=1 Tax=Romanomermis culicivorax TaxID=13658 RepID=A0A915K8L3_ROMCU